MRRPDLSFVIPVRNDANRLRRCLETIHRGTPQGTEVEVVVADNGSTDDSASVAEAAGAVVLHLPALRLGELRNKGAAAARGCILAFVDADHEIVPGWIAAAIEDLESGLHSAVGAPCRPPSPPTWVQRLYDRLRRHPAGQEPAEWLGSGNMAVRRGAFEAVGGFDETLETCEDVDLCRKLRVHGYAIVADRRLGNVHYGDPQTLKQVFVGELWRGRDNVRVSLRRPLAWRTTISAAIPLASLGAAVIAVMGLAMRSVHGLALAGLAGGFVAALVGVRAFMMLRSLWSADWPRALAVAAAYEAGRALAIAGRFGHRRRRGRVPA